jgi:peptide/nickel transport system ATP-binding protein
LMAPATGHIAFDGMGLDGIDKDRSTDLRRRIQLIFQDPLSSLNPRRRIESILTRPQEIFFGVRGQAARDRAVELLEDMELSADLLKRFPRQLSGGQQQRVAIARAFAANPDLILCDEITSALDVSVQAHVLKLLKGIQQKTGAACLFISHDLGVVKQVADETVVLKNGQVVEAGVTRAVFNDPSHNYTRMLLAAALRREDYADYEMGTRDQ